MVDSDKTGLTVEALIALIFLVASFMYIYNYFVGRALLDVLIAVIVFAGSAVWLFSIVGIKK
ncbi:MAG: hypothetical protein PHH08_02885 [Candidatus ainarchaeum sp.]|nr:hypothetical protein [Candidatus ainarchaeum sp.]